MGKPRGGRRWGYVTLVKGRDGMCVRRLAIEVGGGRRKTQSYDQGTESRRFGLGVKRGPEALDAKQLRR